MTIQFFSDKLRESLNKKLKQFNPDTDDLFRLGSLLTLMQETIRELKDFVSTYEFKDQQEEISFFKTVKPVFLGEYFYYKKLFAFKLFSSFRDAKARHENYHVELKKLERYAVRNRHFYEYSMRGATDLDHQYFLRGRNDHDALDRDEKFSTGYDTRVARIQANELIRLHISRMLDTQAANLQASDLQWTASKAALIELVYALHVTRAFNHGSADIKPIARAFETCFNISLGNYYRVFQDIRLRKGNSTAFLDQLKEKLQQHIDNADT